MAKSIMTLCLKEIVHWNQWVSYFPTKLMTYTEKVMSLSSINLVKMVISHRYQCNSYCTRRSSCIYFIWFAKDGDSVCFMYDMMKAFCKQLTKKKGILFKTSTCSNCWWFLKRKTCCKWKCKCLSTTLRKNQATHTEKPAHEFSSISQTCVYYVDLSLNKPFWHIFVIRVLYV